MLRFCLLVLFVSLPGNSAEIVVPDSVLQGNVLRITSADPNAATAILEKRTVKLFRQTDGELLGLMPIPANHNTGTFTLEVHDLKNQLLLNHRIQVIDAHYPVQDIHLSPAKQSLRATPAERQAVDKLRNTVTNRRYWTEPFLAPTKNCVNSPYGVARYWNGKPTGAAHLGLDLRSPAGTPIRAAAAGTVQIAQFFKLGGRTVGIDHGQGVTSFYLHMSRIVAKEGAIVKRGQVIGYVGATGRATGPHLHWQIDVNGVSVNPMPWVGSIPPCSQ